MLRYERVRLLVNDGQYGLIDSVVEMPETRARAYVEADRAEYVEEDMATKKPAPKMPMKAMPPKTMPMKPMMKPTDMMMAPPAPRAKKKSR